MIPRNWYRSVALFQYREASSMAWLAFWLIASSGIAPTRAATTGSEASSLDTPFLHFSINALNGRCQLADKTTGIEWAPAAAEAPFGTASIRAAGQVSRVVLGPCTIKSKPSELLLEFRPLTNQPSATIEVRVSLQPDERTIQLACEKVTGLELLAISPLPDLLAVTDSGKGYLVVPVREGLLIPADSGLQFTHRFDTYAYEGCHMEMLGLVQSGAALLVTWDDPYVAVDVRSTLPSADAPTRRQRLAAELTLTKSAKILRLSCCGHGDYVSIAKAYRQIAKERGLFVGWDQKLKTNPDRARLFGAANIKLWSALDRRMNEESTKEEAVHVNWTFDEAAQVAEHYKKDLQLDRVLFTVGGWIHRGYDNQHPDILPSAPECGGDAAFADCARRVMEQGYLFCLHDNYQDIYRDSPSWNERFVMKTPEGKLARGGHWAGGLAFLTCSQMAVELAQRPQNLVAVKNLSHANAYFIDTTYAAGLQECFDPQHPLTRSDDLKWKQALSDYAREVFGVFGSECGREWAIPHSDFFEGLTGVSGRYFHDTNLPEKLGASVIPLFELVYRDCIAMYGKYGYDPSQAARYVLQHISLARPLNYHSIPAHLYWKTQDRPERPLALYPAVAEVSSAGPRQFRISYLWHVELTSPQPWRVFVHFTDVAGEIKFQNDQEPDPPISQWPRGPVRQGPFTVTVPPGLDGTFEVRMGLFDASTGRRALLQGRKNRNRGYLVGKLEVNGDRVAFKPSDESSRPTEKLDVFTQADNGWADGLGVVDQFLKNTYEILSPLNELTAQLPMTRHEFLSNDRKVQRTVFGRETDEVVVTVNQGDTEYLCTSKLGGQVRLPALGFLAEAPDFIAFYSRNWAGAEFSAPSLFTLRSLDKNPLATSRKVRVFHAFGDEKINLEMRPVAVVREAVVDPNTGSKN